MYINQNLCTYVNTYTLDTKIKLTYHKCNYAKITLLVYASGTLIRCGTPCVITHVIRMCIITLYDRIYGYISVCVERSREVTHGVVVLKEGWLSERE